METETVKFIMVCLGYFLIYKGCDVGRPKEYDLPIFSGLWWLQMFFLVAGVLTVHHNML
jgi:lipopolysaccharide export LptBFGC system permease protein LptF